jgi:hypothetical protein
MGYYIWYGKPDNGMTVSEESISEISIGHKCCAILYMQYMTT